MNTVKIRLTNVDNEQYAVYVDGKKAELKRNKFGSLACDVPVERDEVRVEVKKYSVLHGPYWFLMGLLSFILSVFGIFEPRYGRSLGVDCAFTLKISGDCDVRIAMTPTKRLKGDAPAAELRADGGTLEVESNALYTDGVVQRRRLTLFAVKLAFWIGAIVGIVAIIVKMIG